MVKDDPGCTDATASFHFFSSRIPQIPDKIKKYSINVQIDDLIPGFFQMVET